MTQSTTPLKFSTTVINPPITQTRMLSHPLITLALAFGIYIFLAIMPFGNQMIKATYGHFYVVSIISGIAAVLAVAMGISGTRLRNPQVIFVSLSFISLTMLFGIHGLTTPGVIFEFSSMVGVSVQLSFTVMALWLLLSSLPGDHRFARPFIGVSKQLIPFWTTLMLLLLVVSVLSQTIGDSIPINQAPVQWFFAGLTILIAGFTGFRFWQSYKFSRFPFQSAIAHSSGLMVVSQIIVTTAPAWSIGWWFYHVLLLLVVLIPIFGLVQQYSRGQSLAVSVTGLFSTDPKVRLEAGISPSVRALITATEARDTYTAGHSKRVGLTALKVGTLLNLKPSKLRALIQGAILHDIGKLETPDNLLNYPGKLDPDQMAVIQTHTTRGYEMCKQLGFMQEELEVILFHHERLDGSGYPRGLRGDQIPNMAKILAVIDVYDALTSDRVYRKAWSSEKAIDYLLENRGFIFEPEYVNVCIEVFSSE